jgi:thioesterase domain-containing protein
VSEPDLAAIEAYLHEQIPISAAMGIRVERADPSQVTLSAPLEPNLNHRSTVFGGSCASVAIYAAWTQVYLRVQATGIASRVVISRSVMDYDAPISGTFAATTDALDEQDWTRFATTLRRRGRARISLTATVRQGDAPVARYEGTYAAIALDRGAGTAT